MSRGSTPFLPGACKKVAGGRTLFSGVVRSSEAVFAVEDSEKGASRDSIRLGERLSGPETSIGAGRSATWKIFPPRAYILGAPKCGTTAMARYLSEHPQIAFSRPKEPHFFADDLPGLRTCTTAEEYLSCFRPDSDTRMLTEASVWYLYSAVAVKRILQQRSDALLIVMLRNPVKMLASLHRQLVHALDEDEEDLGTAWRLSNARARGQRIPRTCRAPATLVYTRTAAFGEMMARLFAQVGRDRCLVLFQEEMQADAARVYRRTLDFLGLADDGRRDFPRVNEAARFRSRSLHYLVARGRGIRELASRPLKNMLGVKSLGLMKGVRALNTAGLGPAMIPPGLSAEIAQYYADDIQRLCELLGRDLSAEFGWPAGPAGSG